MKKENNNTLVRYPCMIQDIFNPEASIELIKCQNNATKETKIMNTKYQDFDPNVPNYSFEIVEGSYSFRNSAYATPVPAQTQWSVDCLIDLSRLNSKQSKIDETNNNLNKKDENSKVEEEDDDEEEMDNFTPQKRKKSEKEEESEQQMQRQIKQPCSVIKDEIINHPLSTSSDLASSILYFYDVNECPFKLHEGCDIVGIYSYIDKSKNKSPLEVEEEEEEINEFGDILFNPSSDEVGRIHVIGCRKLNASYPLYNPFELVAVTEYNNPVKLPLYSSIPSSIPLECDNIRNCLISDLTDIFGGDKLVSFYVFYNLLSYVYDRNEDGDLIFGNFPINISRIEDSNLITMIESV